MAMREKESLVLRHSKLQQADLGKRGLSQYDHEVKRHILAVLGFLRLLLSGNKYTFAPGPHLLCTSQKDYDPKALEDLVQLLVNQ